MAQAQQNLKDALQESLFGDRETQLNAYDRDLKEKLVSSMQTVGKKFNPTLFIASNRAPASMVYRLMRELYSETNA